AGATAAGQHPQWQCCGDAQGPGVQVDSTVLDPTKPQSGTHLCAAGARTRAPKPAKEDVRGSKTSYHRRVSGRPIRREPRCAAEGASSRPCCSTEGGGVHRLWDTRVPPEREAHSSVQSGRPSLFVSSHERG